MKKIIRKILREEFEYKQQLFNLLKTGDSDNIEMVRMISQGQGIDVVELLIEFFKENIEPPYFKLLNHFDLSDGELNYVLSGIFGEPVTINKMSYGFIIYDENGCRVYYENHGGYWVKYEYDQDGNRIYYEDSDGEWRKYGYDKNGNEIYKENSDGFWIKTKYDEYENEIYYENSDGQWEKYEYDKNGKVIYRERFDGYWNKREYDENGKQIYFENSDGLIRDYR